MRELQAIVGGFLIAITACANEELVPPPEPTMVAVRSTAPDVGAIVAGLPWTFTESERWDANGLPIREVLLVSQEARSESEQPPVYLRARFTTMEYADTASAAEAFEEMAAEAHPDTGLSYAWDLVILNGRRLHHLHGDCTLSGAVFERMGENLRQLLRDAGAESFNVLECRCGGGCERT